MDCSYDSYAKTYAVFFCGLFHNSHVNAFSFFRGPIVSTFTLFRQIILFLSATSWPSKGSQNNVSLHAGGGFVTVTPIRVYCKLCLFWACCILSFCQVSVAQYYHWACTRAVLGFLGPFHRFWAPLSHSSSFVPFYSSGHPRLILSLSGSFVPFYSFGHPWPVSSLSGFFVPFGLLCPICFPLGVPGLFAFHGLPRRFS